MIKKQCGVLASKEQSEALKQGPDLNCRCSPAERREGCRAVVMHRLSQVGNRHLPVEECAPLSLAPQRKGWPAEHTWRQPDCRGLSGSEASFSCLRSTTCMKKNFHNTHTHTHAATSSRHLSSSCQSAGHLLSRARWPIQKFYLGSGTERKHKHIWH